MSSTHNGPTSPPAYPGDGPERSARATDRVNDPYFAPDQPAEAQLLPAAPGTPSPNRREPVRPEPADEPGSRRASKARTVWSGIIVTAFVLILLLIFIVQNTTDVTIYFFGLSGQLPISVALLFAAIAGVLLLAIPGSIRMLQLRKAARTVDVATPGALHREDDVQQ